MTALASQTGTATDQLVRFSDLRKRPAFRGPDKIGALRDLVVVDKDVVAEVTHVCVGRPFGRPMLFVPWESVRELTSRSIVIDDQRGTELLEQEPAGAVLLEDCILDKKVLDVEGREVEVVYDVILALKSGRLYVIGVDLSRRALLRRAHLRWLANLTASITDTIERDIVAWNLVEPLPEGIGSFSGDIRLKIVKAELAKMPPVDVARILEQLSLEHRLAVFEGMDAASASDALEELDPKAQRELVAAMPKEKVGRLIDAMTPAQAADVLAVLPWSDVHAILGLLEAGKSRKVRQILQDQDQLAANFVSSDFVKLGPDTTVLQARENLRAAREREAIAYLYVLDEDDHLLGVVRTTDLLTSPDEAKMRALMKGAPLTLSLEGTLKEASELFGRYGYRALPVVDRHGKMHGIVPYRDVITLRNHHHKRAP